MAPVIIFIIITTIIMVIIKFMREEMSSPSAAVVAGTVPACIASEGACWGNGTDVVCVGLNIMVISSLFWCLTAAAKLPV